MKWIKRILFIVLLSTVSFILVTSIYENVELSIKLENFKKNSIFDEVNSTSTKKFYYHENSDYYSKEEYLNPGNYCDILVTTYGAPREPILHELITYTVGGHAALVGMAYKDQFFGFGDNTTIETTLNNQYQACYYTKASTWDNHFDFPNYYILRVDLTEDQAIKVFNEAVSMLGDPYNYFFVTNYKESSYCSDLVSKAFRAAGINLNYDLGTTTVLDLATSSKTKIIGYKYYSNGISYYYTY